MRESKTTSYENKISFIKNITKLNIKNKALKENHYKN